MRIASFSGSTLCQRDRIRQKSLVLKPNTAKCKPEMQMSTIHFKTIQTQAQRLMLANTKKSEGCHSQMSIVQIMEWHFCGGIVYGMEMVVESGL